MNRTVPAILAAAGFLIPGVSAHAAEDLAGTTVLAGAGAGVAQVELAQPATLDRAALRVDGSGSFAGFALVAEGDDLKRPILTGGRIRAAGVPDQTFMMSGNATLQDFGPTVDVPAGRYRLYLLADRPATVRLGVAGRSGERTLDALRPVPFDQRRPSVRYLPQGASGVGDHATLGGPGLMLGALTTVYTATAADITTACWYQGEASSGDPSAFAPGCPTAPQRTVFNTVNADPSAVANRSTAIAVTSDGGVFGQGFGVVSAGVRDSFEYEAMWLTFDRSPWEDARAAAPSAEPAGSAATTTGAPSAPSAAPAQAMPVGGGAPSRTGTAAGPAMTVKAVTRRALLRAGLAVTVRGATGVVRLRAVLAGRTVAVGSARASGGRAEVVLRPTRAGRRALSRARGPITLTVTGGGLSRRVALR
jgi:hypothetical protein